MYVNQQTNVHFTGAGLTSTVLGTVPWCSICRCGYGYHRILDGMAIGHLFFGNAWPWFLEISPSTKHNPDQQWRISSEWITTYIGVSPLPAHITISSHNFNLLASARDKGSVDRHRSIILSRGLFGPEWAIKVLPFSWLYDWVKDDIRLMVQKSGEKTSWGW